MKATVSDIVPAVLPGIFPARFDAIEEKNNETGKFWLWSFTLHVPADRIGDTEQWAPAGGDSHSFIPVTATTSPRITPRTKAAKWIEALTKSKLSVDDEVDFDAMVGKVAQVVIELSDTGYSRINALLPAPDAAPHEVQAAPAPEGEPVETAD